MQSAHRRLQLGVIVLALVAGGCAAGKAFRQGESRCARAISTKRWPPTAGPCRRRPTTPNYKIALQRAMQAASRAHLERAHEFEQQDQLEAALGEYRLASEYDPSNRTGDLEGRRRSIARSASASRRRGRGRPIEQLRERARAASRRADAQPGVARAAELRFNNVSLRDILNFIASSDRHQHHLRPRSAGPAGHGAARRRHARAGAQPDHDDEPAVVQGPERAVDLRLPGHAAQARAVRRAGGPDVLPLARRRRPRCRRCSARSSACPASPCSRRLRANKTANTITVRGTSAVVQILERIIEQNDKPRAEIVVDVEILEVDRTRAKSYGLNLSEYARRRDCSRRRSRRAARRRRPRRDADRHRHDAGTDGTTTHGQRHVDAAERADLAAAVQPEHDLARRQHGRLLPRRADGDRPVPRDATRAPRSIAKPQLRGAEGTKLTLKLGTPDSGHLDQLHADRHRRRRREPAELVPVQGRRREHRHDADGDARRRHPARSDARQQRARRRRRRSAA